jgi:hypothetical protein
MEEEFARHYDYELSLVAGSTPKLVTDTRRADKP